MSGFTINYDVPYEGGHEVEVPDLDAVKAWLKANRSSYDFSLDNVRVRPCVAEVDVYELMKGEA